MGNRIKTDIRLTQVVSDEITEVVDRLGISKNAFYAVSIALGLGVAKSFLMGNRESLHKLFSDVLNKLLLDNK
jgi:hypothetical protein